MKKRLISIILVLCLVLSVMPSNVFAGEQNGGVNPVPGPFKDVKESDWYYEHVKYAVENGIFNGVGDASFLPDGTMTRGMYVTVLGRIAGIQAVDYPYRDTFSDVAASAYYSPYVVWAVENNITKGTGNGKFDPDGLVTREQMAVFTARFFDALGIDFDGPEETAGDSENGTAGEPADTSAAGSADEPKDLSEISDWAKESVLRLWKAGILKGDSNGYFNAKSNASRAEGTAISMRVHQSLVQWSEEHADDSSKDGDKSGDGDGSENDGNNGEDSGQSGGNAGNSSTGSNNGAGSGGDNSSDDDDDDTYTSSHTVSFQTNGGSAINAVSVSHGGSISNLPTPQRMGFVFLGWYRDPAFTQQYTSGSAVYSNLTLHAKYAELESVTSMEDESFALVDQASSLTFTLLSSSAMTSSQVQNAITLARADEIEPEELLVTEGSEASSFILSASGGFTPGAAYTLTLNNDALTFSGREENMRTCTFTIAQEESDDLPLSSDIIYIPAAELSDIVKNGVEVASLSVPLISNEEITEINGTFTYANAGSLSVGDTLCIYSGNTAPNTGASSAELVDTEIAYVAVTGISGTTVSYTEASARNVLALPDTLPIYVGAESPVSNYTAGGTSFTTELAELDFSDFSAMGLDAGTTLDEGDYLFFHTNPGFPTSDDLSEEDIIGYAVVNDVALSNNNASVTVTYATVTEEEMREGLSYYARTPVSGELLLGDTDIARLEDSLEQQAMDSGFARDAAVYLSTVAMATNGFEDATGSRSITVPDLSAVYASAASQQGFSDSVQVRVNASIGTDTRKIGRNGVRAEITVSFEVPVSAGDNEVVISGSATFVEEISISLDASGSPVWDHWWFVYWIKDYNVYSYTNVYNYTGMFIEAHIRSQGGGVSLDVSDEIQELLTSTDSEEIISGAGDLLDAYCDLIQGGSDWIELFEQNIFEKRIPVLFGIIQIKISADFVVSAYINVALGTSFEYSDGTCYAFYGGIFARNFRSYTIKLADEVFTFRFYTLGDLGIRAGIRLELAVGLFNCDWNSVGFTAEVGVYGKLYGYFYYEYTAVNDVSSSLSTGALYFELGIYLEINFVAQVMSGVVSSSWTLYENEWPLLYAGSRYSAVDFLSNETPEIRLKDENKSFSLPESFRIMKTLDLREGFYATLTYPLSDFNITFTNAAFSVIGNEVVVTPGINDHVLVCDMTITWRHGTMAFSSLPISRTYRIHWDNVDENGYRLSFDSLGGSLVNSISGLYDQPITAPTPPVKTGYSFAGWYSDNTYSQEFTFSTMPAENMRLYAKWGPNHNTPYVVRHYKQDLTNESSYTLADTERLTGTTNTSVTPGTKSYTGFTRPDTRSMIIAPDGSASISYYYTRKSYSLTVDARFTASSDPLDDYKPGDDPSELSDYLKTTMVKYGARVSIPAFSRAGWHISQWSPAIQQDMTMPANNLSFTGAWAEDIFTVTLDANGGSVEPASKTVAYLGQYGGLPIPTRSGCTFSGWYPSEDEEDNAYGTRVTSDTVTIPGSHTFYAKWQGRDFTVTFDTNGGYLETDTKTVTYLSGYGDLPIPASAGFTFLGWYLSEDGNDNGNGTQVQEDTKVNIPDNHTLYAAWEVNDSATYTVRHHLQTAPGSDEYTLDMSETFAQPAGVTIPVAPKSYSSYLLVGDLPFLTVLADDSASIDLYYNLRCYNLYYLDGAANLLAQEYQAGATITPPENPQKTGFSFTGWEPAIPATMPFNDVYVTPTYERKTYTITLSAADAVPPYSASATVEYEGTSVTDIVYPERPGYMFTGWNAPGGSLLINTNGSFHYEASNSAYLTPNADGTCYWVYDGDITLSAGWDDGSQVNSYEELQTLLASPEVGNIVVTNTLIVPNGSVIDGGGRTLYFRNNNRLNSIFALSSTSSCTLRNMTIDFGGNVGIQASHAIVMEGVNLKNATTYAFWNQSSAELRNCSITGSQGYDGVLFCQRGSLTMTNCSVYDNTGDGINCTNGMLTMDGGSVTLCGGRGIRNYGGQVLLNNCTIANNGSDGIYTSHGTTNGVNVTVAGNQRGSVTDTSGAATFVNSVLVDNATDYGDVTMDVINTGATLINCLTGDIWEYQHVLTDCISASKQTVFHSYESGKPVLTQMADGTWAARLSADSEALTGGCNTYFSIDHGSAAYGSTPTYIEGSEGAVKVTTYQGGGVRTDGVIGAYNQ